MIRNRFDCHITVLAVYLFFASEWLFHVTKPSALSGTPWSVKLSVLFVPPLFISLVSCCVILILSLLVRLAHKIGAPKFKLVLLIPALVTGVVLFMLLENYTYTMNRITVLSSHGIFRVIYNLVFVALCLAAWRILSRWGRAGVHSRGELLRPVSYLLLLVSSCFFLFMMRKDLQAAQVRRLPGYDQRQANIVLVGIDGVTKDTLSAYGYARETSPFLASIKDEMLVFANAFTNCSRTACSLASLLSGKLPTRTKVLNFPDIFNAVDSVNHLPGILRSAGYTSMMLGVRKYADMFDLNMRQGFNFVNFRKTSLYEPGFLSRFPAIIGSPEYHFLLQTLSRVSERAKHMLWLEDKKLEFDVVSKGDGARDLRNTREALRFISESPEPFFLHIHLLGTHGPEFYPKSPYFSLGKQLSKESSQDFYEDVIRDADSYLKELVDALKFRGKFENTLLIVYSDHGSEHRIDAPIPLMMRFPHAELRGMRDDLVSLADVAPTVLGYLGFPVPSWMSGSSLLKPHGDNSRKIITVRDYLVPRRSFRYRNPPFYNFQAVGVIACHNLYEWNLESLNFVRLPVTGFSAPCADSAEGDVGVRKFIIEHMQSEGFDVSLLSGKSAD